MAKPSIHDHRRRRWVVKFHSTRKAFDKGFTQSGGYKEMRAVNQDEESLLADAMQVNLYKLLRSFESCNQRCLARYGITASQGRALLALPTESSTSMNEFACAMELSRSTMTRMADTLVASGLVDRWKDSRNRRLVRVSLTARGDEIQLVLNEARRELQRRIIEELQEEDGSAILGALEKLRLAVEKAEGKCCLEVQQL